jgi:CubicO group peptidase (beta-lactamase class C family)
MEDATVARDGGHHEPAANLTHEPGMRFAYSDAGYVCLAVVI